MCLIVDAVLTLIRNSRSKQENIFKPLIISVRLKTRLLTVCSTTNTRVIYIEKKVKVFVRRVQSKIFLGFYNDSEER